MYSIYIECIYTKPFWPTALPRGPANSKFNTSLLLALGTVGSTFKLLLTIAQHTLCYGITRKKLRFSMNWCCCLRFPLPSQKRAENHNVHFKAHITGTSEFLPTFQYKSLQRSQLRTQVGTVYINRNIYKKITRLSECLQSRKISSLKTHK